MRVVVQKFGGTSVSNQEKRAMAVKHIIEAKNRGFLPVVVVSAMGRKGDPYATDTFLDFITCINEDMHSRELDLLMSCGEIISCVTMVGLLESTGYRAKSFTGAQAGIITDDEFNCAKVLTVKSDNLLAALKSGVIPVVAGFQGITEKGDITTLGRGGSDTTAAVLGEALSAFSIEIYTDVDGIMTADPRIVPNASVLKHISYSEVFQIAEQGAKVIHPRAIEIAMRANIPMVIKNTMNNSEGTIISSNLVSDAGDDSIEIYNLITSITHIKNRTQIAISNIALAAQNKLLAEFASNGISIDLINIFPDKIIFTIDGCNSKKAGKILANYGFQHSIIDGCSKISAIGNRIRGKPGIMARIINALVDKNIKVLQTADSHTTISCLVHGEDTVEAVLALHEEFKLDKR